ncbi:MAG TPA: hypothetical protein VJ757_10245 [Pseudonocardiaceae bacterium]|nr:hypothetical protein [Pseudonocardiaceae bacterium]
MQWPNLRATRVACALGHCREIVYSAAVVTGALDATGNPDKPERRPNRPRA